MNKIVQKFYLFLFLTPIYLLSLQLIHELFHCLTAILTGNEVISIYYIFEKNEGLGSLVAIVKINFINPEYKWLISLSGSLGSVILAGIISYIGIKKRSGFLIFNNAMILSMEFMYWGYYPFIKWGDPYIFYKLVGIKNYIPLSAIFFICVIAIFVVFFHFLYKSFEINLEVYYNEKNKINLEKKLTLTIYDY